jgi:hypothetical protein
MTNRLCLLGLLLAFCAALAAQSAFAAEDPLAWVHRDKIRMGWSPANTADYQDMADAGMNAVMPRYELDASIEYDPTTAAAPLSKKDKGTIDSLRRSSRTAKQAGLRYFHCLDIAASSQTWRTGFQDNPARFNDGALPSPVDPVYWRRAILQRVQRTMDLLEGQEYAFDAVIVDPEMYALHGAIVSGIDHGAFAFASFLKDTKRDAPKDLDTPSKRREWLAGQNITSAYQKWQFDRIASHGAQLRELVHARHPGAVLGFIIYHDALWFNAIAHGLHAPGHPVFVGPETTYSGVMDDSFIAFEKALRAHIKVPILFVPGIRMGLEQERVPAEYLKVVPGNLYRRCQHAEGYWVWAIYRFGKEGQREHFFSALRQANSALDRQAQTGVVDDSLKAAPLPIDLPEDFLERLQAAGKLIPIPDTAPRTPQDFVRPNLRGVHTLFMWPTPGKETTLTVRARKLGNLLSPTSVQIFDPDGRLVWAETIAPNDARVLRVPVDKAGPYAAVISAAMNGFQVVDVSCPAQFDQEMRLNARRMGGLFYFYVPADTPEFTVNVNAPHTEPADFILKDPSGTTVKSWKTLKTSVDFPVETPKAGVWSLQVDHMVDDAWFKLVDLPDRFALRSEDLHTAP